ncbi:glycosyltransferase family 2 protein [Flavisolibacter ginsenosidimutans]|uniref:Glycosyltransferase family 2 protein n=1 Tax=Flavisolibacter ginsenosidimutans TaxID=661481 RepID=A0A5B8UEE5_9BACT|nr:glycosyltransferase family 2 protein [Flavisolibacter ginsenosidimutans]QEC54873.1 glycosyltransferase family 2 protein [Flavisolibacter ginsenosidimutans]
MVSVLTTSYNREDFIGEAIESVLASTYTDFEYIIVDDCSKDGTVDIIRRYAKLDKRIKFFVNEKNLGDYGNRNKAAGYASRKYIKYIDSDDLLYPHCLQVMVNSMERFPEAGFGLSSTESLRHPFPVLLKPKEAYLEHFFESGHFYRAPGSAIIRKEAFDAVGGFSGERMIGDTELWFRLGRQFPLVKFPPFLYWSRYHESQESQSDYAKKKYDELQKRVLENAFAHKDCPLNDEEKERVLKMLRRKKMKSTVFKYLSSVTGN